MWETHGNPRNGTFFGGFSSQNHLLMGDMLISWLPDPTQDCMVETACHGGCFLAMASTGFGRNSGATWGI